MRSNPRAGWKSTPLFLLSEGNFSTPGETYYWNTFTGVFCRQDGAYSGQGVLLSPLKSVVEKDHLDALNLKIKCSTGQLIISLVWLKYYLTS